MRLNATILESMALRHMRGHRNDLVLAQGQLASGLRIQNAFQDAAGLSVATKLGATVRGLHASSRAMQDGLSLLRLADGGMADVMAQLQRMRELTVRAGGSVLSAEDREAIRAELAQLSAGIDGIVDTTHFNTMRILGKADTGTALSPAMLFGRSPLSLHAAASPTRATMLGGAVSLNTSAMQPATRARMTSGAIALDLTQAKEAEPATMLMDPVVLNPAASTPATPATLTSARVQITQGGNPASLKGSNLTLTGSSTDFGVIVINGVTTVLGVYPPPNSTYDPNDREAASMWIAEKINANADNTVTAVVGANDKRIELISKATGSASHVTIGAGTSTRTGFTPGESRTGSAGSATTDLGRVTLNGVQVDLGVMSNAGLSSQLAAQQIASRINTSLSGTLTATVGGAFGDQITLTTAATGVGASIAVQGVQADSNGNGADNGFSGFTAPTTVTGTAGTVAQTDLGSVTIDGVTTSFDTLDNAGLTTRLAAQHMVNRINNNAASTVIASLAGPNDDQIMLTAKTAGAAGFTVQATSNDSNADASDNGSNGFKVGTATGQDADAGTTDFGAISINGITVTLGTFDNTGQTAATAAQWIVNRITATAGLSVDATLAPGNQITLTAKTVGTAGNFTLTTTTSRNGFTDGASLPGTNADAGKTDFGTLSIDGTAVTLGEFDNNGQTAANAAQWIVSEINDQAGSRVTASLVGGRIQLASTTLGAAGNFTLAVQSDSNGNPSDNGTHGLTSGTTTSGTDGASGLTDFGRMTINGTVITLGVLDSATYTPASAAAHLASVITAAGAGVEATVQDGRLVLRSLDPEAELVITDVTADSNGDTSDDSAVGFLSGDRDLPGGSSEASGSKTLSEGIVIQLGAEAGQVITLKTPLDAYAETLGVSASVLDVSSEAAAAQSLQRIELAISRAGEIRTTLGAAMNRVEHALGGSMVAREALTASESRIRDADAAQAILSLTRNQVASLSAQAILKHMHFSRATLLTLLA